MFIAILFLNSENYNGELKIGKSHAEITSESSNQKKGLLLFL